MSPGPAARERGAAAGALPRRLREVAEFEYVGATALVVEGPVTGKRYRFPAPGAVVEVDLLDRGAVAAVPHLRELRFPR
jgi:hypothetical protein